MCGLLLLLGRVTTSGAYICRGSIVAKKDACTLALSAGRAGGGGRRWRCCRKAALHAGSCGERAELRARTRHELMLTLFPPAQALRASCELWAALLIAALKEVEARAKMRWPTLTTGACKVGWVRASLGVGVEGEACMEESNLTSPLLLII